MNILSKVAWKAMWKNKTRTLVTVIGIILSAAMFTAVTTLGYSLWAYLLKMEIYDTGDYFLQVDYASQDYVHTLEEDPRVSEVNSLGMLGYTLLSAEAPDKYIGMQCCAVAAGDADFYKIVTVPLEEGSLPQNGGEIVIPRNVYDHLKEANMPCEVGQTLTLDIQPRYDALDGSIPQTDQGEAFSKSYRIVGISKAFSRLDDFNIYMSPLLTYADGGDAGLWYRVYLKTHDPKDAYALLREIPEGLAGSVNSGLLQLYGASPYTNYNTVILLICCILAAIIMVGSVSLIYNAFSISVSERTKQFGLLASVGATRKQIRRAVFSEAMLLSAVGIPLGLISGYAGIAVTLNILSARIHTVISTGDGSILLEPVLSPLAMGTAAAIALVTVLISATIPAWRATRISPLDTIRQKNDYAVPGKNIHVSKLTARLFGLPGILARKYYKVSKKKYRATVISLIISIVLFISAASVSQLIHSSVDRAVNTESYDMMCFGTREALEEVRQQPFVKEAAYSTDSYYRAFVPDEYLDESYLQCWQTLRERSGITKNIHDIRLIYLEDEVFRQFLAQQGLPEEPYFTVEIPSALVVGKEIATYRVSSQTGEQERYTLCYVPYNAEGQEVGLFESALPDELTVEAHKISDTMTYVYFTDENGDNVVAVVPLVEDDHKLKEVWDKRTEYLIRWEQGTAGITISYYLRDIATGEVAEEPTVVDGEDTPRLKLGTTVQELPFGITYQAISAIYQNYLILPLSAAPESMPYGLNLCITVSDYVAAKTYMQTHLGEQNYRDYKESEENSRTMILLINVFSYGFIVLISLICVANVFNTISTNVALRRRDFGMLRSTGFREKDLLKMMNYECLTYGFKAIAIGFPMSLLLSYWIMAIEGKTGSAAIAPPWSAFLVVALCVFAVVFVTMFYAMSKLRKDNPIDAIRMENI